MPRLREDVIDAICEEDWPDPDHEVNSTTIYERLKRNGVNTSEADVQQVLDQLAEDLDITLAVGPRSTHVVQTVYEDLCT